MTSTCKSYYSAEKVFVEGFECPKPDSDATAVFCCGFNDIKYCCDDPDSFFPYEYGYMWWLSVGALLGLSIAAVVLLGFIITLCVLCYLFIATKPRGLDNGLPLRAPGHQDSQSWRITAPYSYQGNESTPQEGPNQSTAPAGPQGLRKHFLRGKLDCDNQPPDPDRLFQRCFMATVTTINVEGSA